MTEVLCTCGRPTSGAWLCERCQKTLAIAIAHVSVYYADLETVSTKRTRYGSTGATKGSVGKEQPLPVDGRFVNVPTTTDEHGNVVGGGGAGEAIGSKVRATTRATVATWARSVMEEQPQLVGPTCGPACLHTSCAAVRRRLWPSDTVRSMCAYLDRQFRWIVREIWAPEFLDEMRDCEEQMRRLIDRPADRWYAGRCSAIDGEHTCTAEIYASADRGTVTCPACTTIHDVADRRDFLLAQAKDYVVTATEAASALLAWTDYDGSEQKLVDRIRKWRDRDKLAVSDVTSLLGRDRHLYRLGDIQDLMVASAQTDQRRALGRAS